MHGDGRPTCYSIRHPKGQDLAINMDGEAVSGFAFGVKIGNHEKLILEFNKALAQAESWWNTY